MEDRVKTMMKEQIRRKSGCEAFTDPGDCGKIHTGCLTSRPEPRRIHIYIIPDSVVDLDVSVVHLCHTSWSCSLPVGWSLITSCFYAGAIDGLQEPLTVEGSDTAPNGPTQ